MNSSTGTYLDRIIERTAADLPRRKSKVSLDSLRATVNALSPPVPFATQLNRDVVSVIAEFKRASPSKGVFNFTGKPEDVALDYIKGGASGISCLTDGPFFQGSLDDLDEIVAIAHENGNAVGVLRKDFTIDSYQIVEARAHGADCILLIAAVLDDKQMRDFRIEAESMGMSVLVEVHDEVERERALRAGATLLGVNNRDLRTFKVDLATTEQLAVGLDSAVTLVAESGIASSMDVERMAKAGAAAVLVGESLILRADRTTAVREIASVPR